MAHRASPSSLRPRVTTLFGKECQRRLIPLPEGESLWTHRCAGRFGRPGRAIGAPRLLRGTVMPGADEVGNRRVRDKLTIAEVCADLGISRRTFYEWRMKNRAPKCITLPNGSLRIRRSEYQRWLASREAA
jgi:predicted DNA-binding transcriptional regulator AlpA